MKHCNENCQTMLFLVDVEELTPLLVDLEIAEGSLRHVDHGLTIGGLGERVARNLWRGGTHELQSLQVRALVEGIAANFLDGGGQGHGGQIGATLESTGADALHRVWHDDLSEVRTALEQVAGHGGKSVGQVGIAQVRAVAEST